MIKDSWVFHLVSNTGQDMGVLSGVIPGSASLDANVDADIRWSGSVELLDPDRYDWNVTRIKPCRIVDGVQTPYGVYIVWVNDRSYSPTGVTGKLDLFDRTLAPSEDAVVSSYTVKAGVSVTSAVRELLSSTGETGISITATSDVLRTDMTWEAGTSKLKIINELADAAGYFALWCDRNGQYRFEPYTPPTARPVLYTFTPGESAIHLPEFSRSQDTTVHNQIVLVSQETSDVPALTAIVRNEDPTSPWSFQAQGRWITRVQTGVEATSQAVLDQHAQRLLALEGGNGAVFERTMLPQPFELNSVVGGVDGREVIEKISIDCAPARLMKVTSRGVVS